MLPSIFSENLFDDFFNSAMFPKAEHELYGKHAKNLMTTDVREVENGYEIDMNLPGFKKDEVEIQLQDGCLTVSTVYIDGAADGDADTGEVYLNLGLAAGVAEFTDSELNVSPLLRDGFCEADAGSGDLVAAFVSVSDELR